MALYMISSARNFITEYFKGFSSTLGTVTAPALFEAYRSAYRSNIKGGNRTLVAGAKLLTWAARAGKIKHRKSNLVHLTGKALAALKAYVPPHDFLPAMGARNGSIAAGYEAAQLGAEAMMWL